jgi:hypothetical protein
MDLAYNHGSLVIYDVLGKLFPSSVCVLYKTWMLTETLFLANELSDIS